MFPFRSRKSVSPAADDLDVVSAIWILASNDDNPIITYSGLNHRLGLPEDYNVKMLVASRPELFRPRVPESRLKTWKDRMLSGKSIPGWLTAIENSEERGAAIEAITREDVFRSQFRAHSNAERSPIEIISWGLEHLDRLRKARAEANDASAKKWQMWLVFGVSLIGVISQFLIAFSKYKGWI